MPDSAPQMLREIEELLPQPEVWSMDANGFLHGFDGYHDYYQYGRMNLSPEDARLYIQDDLGVSQRWANKFSEAGIETVGDLVGHTEEDLLRIEGIGSKAIEELKAGLEERNLSSVIEDDLIASSDDMQQLMNMVFSPDDDILLGGEEPVSYDLSGEDMLGEALPPRTYQRNLEDLDAMLNNLDSLGELGMSTTDSFDDDDLIGLDDDTEGFVEDEDEE